MLGENTKAGADATGVRRANMHSAASLTGLDVSDWIDGWLMARVVTYHGAIGGSAWYFCRHFCHGCGFHDFCYLLDRFSISIKFMFYKGKRSGMLTGGNSGVECLAWSVFTPECTTWSATWITSISRMNRAHLYCHHILQQKLAETHKTCKSPFDPMVHSI